MTSHSLSKDEEEHLINRLYSQAIAQHRQTLTELDARYYPTAPPQQISRARLQQSLERQVDQEVQRRRERAGEAEAQVYKTATYNHPRKLNSDEVDDSVRRLYTEAVQRRAISLEESRKRYEATAATSPQSSSASTKLSRVQLQESVERMSRPKKQEYSVDEINAIYGLAPPKA